jgi:hypothetical protein
MSKPNVKRVHIDDHIKSSKNNSGSKSEFKKPRGRPLGWRKNPEPTSSFNSSEPRSGLITSNSHAQGGNGVPPNTPPVSGSEPRADLKAVPVYDTTEEAKGVIQAPFNAIAAITGVPNLALSVPEIEALMPSWKVVYDKRIAPYMGQNADLYTFSFVMANVCLSKWRVYNDVKVKSDKADKEWEKNPPRQSGPTLPTIKTDLAL